MSKPARTLAVCLVLLALAELWLARLRADARGRAGLPEDGDLVFCMGSSRVKAGLDPRAIERALAAAGIERPWVTNVSEDAVTAVGMLLLYMEEVHAALGGTRRSGVVALEARPGGFSEGYLTEAEKTAFLTGELDDLLAGAPIVAGFTANLARARFADAARAAVGGLALFQGTATRALVEQRLLGADPAGAAAPGARWLLPGKGFVPEDGQRAADLDTGRWRLLFDSAEVKDPEFRATQRRAMQQLVERVRQDGFTPLFFLMPVTAEHRAAWPKGRLERVVQQAKELAASLKVPFLDFDAGNALTREDFFDSHHLAPAAAERFSGRFAEDALLPLLRAARGPR